MTGPPTMEAAPGARPAHIISPIFSGRRRLIGLVTDRFLRASVAETPDFKQFNVRWPWRQGVYRLPEPRPGARRGAPALHGRPVALSAQPRSTGGWGRSGGKTADRCPTCDRKILSRRNK